MDNILLDNEERIDRYLSGDMTSDEEKEFESDIQIDTMLRNQALSASHLVKAMDAVGRSRDKVFISQTKASMKSKHISTIWLAIAASIAIVYTICFKTFDYNIIGNIGEEYATIFPVSEIFKGDVNNNMTVQLTGLFNNVAEGKDLDNTIASLSPIWTNYYKSVNVLDIARFDNNKEEAIPYEHYVGWYLTIAYLRNHDKKKAKVVLGQMRSIYREESSIMGSNLFEKKKKIRYLM